MEGSIHLTEAQRKQLLDLYRKHHDPHVRLRSHIILLLAMGQSWRTITTMLFCSSKTISRWKRRFQREGIQALTQQRRGRPREFAAFWVQHVRRWILERPPDDFGLMRTRWCCDVVVMLLCRIHHLQVSRETVRRWLHREGLVWRRPRPVVGPVDPQRDQKITAIRTLLADLRDDLKGRLVAINYYTTSCDYGSQILRVTFWRSRRRTAL